MSDHSNKNGNEAPKSSGQTPAESAPAQNQPELIPPALDSVLRNVGINPQDPAVSKALEVSLTTMMMYGGSLPLAPPQILKEYQKIKPELVDKFVEWTEAQSAHRRELEKTRVDRSERRLDRGQFIAAAVAIGGLFLSTVEGIGGNAYVAAVMAVVAIGGPTAAIWLARNLRTQQQQQAAKPPTPGPPTTEPPGRG
jgi:uncharacterized membrane protein